MKLYEVPNNTMVKLMYDAIVPPGAPELKKGEVIQFWNIDGMYSYCIDSAGNVVHLSAIADVEMIASVN